MKIIFCCGLLMNLFLSCGPGPIQAKKVLEGETKFISVEKLHQTYSQLLPLTAAEKVMGEKAYIIDSSTTYSKDATRFSAGFSGLAKDEKSGNTGKFYFLFEDYSTLEGAKKRYSETYKGNKDHPGIKVVKDLGDEAYFHGDGSNFYFVMVRKRNKVFDLKVNKITSKTSEEEFNKLAREITDKL